MMKKYYAIKYRSGGTAIYHAKWDDIYHRIHYRKGVVYKAFKNREDADAWLETETIPFRTKNTPHLQDQYYCYVDGSFAQKTMLSGWGFVVVLNDEKIGEGYGFKDNVTGSRNIIGEVHATIKGVEWCVNNNIKNVVVVHDYAGIGCWALGLWRARRPVSKEYKEKIDELMLEIEVKFEKVNGHCDIKWNEYADMLTRKYKDD
jgi:ribonuclease HI